MGLIAEARKGGSAESSQGHLVEAGLSERIIGCCIKVHRTLGPGFLEKIHEEALGMELTKAGLKHEHQKPVSVTYDQKVIGEHRLDMVVENRVILELKATRAIEDIHLATARSYLKATNLPLALVINFAKPILEIKRVILTK